MYVILYNIILSHHYTQNQAQYVKIPKKEQRT
nr:MAG TPA: hypothetical protein [Caudoviricetes sp.]